MKLIWILLILPCRSHCSPLPSPQTTSSRHNISSAKVEYSQYRGEMYRDFYYPFVYGLELNVKPIAQFQPNTTTIDAGIHGVEITKPAQPIAPPEDTDLLAVLDQVL